MRCFCISAAITDHHDHRANLENSASPRHTYTDATIEEGPSTPDKMVSGLSTCCDQDEEMWAVPVQEKGPHLPQELAMSSSAFDFYH